MSGTWEAYVMSPFDNVRDTNFNWAEWCNVRNTLSDKWGAAPSSNPAVESDLNQIRHMTGTSRIDYRDEPSYLKELRQLYVDFYKQATGLEPYPFTPIGPSEMYSRNSCNLEYWCTALYYCPGPDDDIIMCKATDLEQKDNWYQSTHFRVKSTGEYLGNDEKVKKSPYRIMRFCFEPERRSELKRYANIEHWNRDKKHLDDLMIELSAQCKTKKCYDFQKHIEGDIDPFAKLVSSAVYYYDQLDLKDKLVE